jgi:hypothetical protein
MPGYLEIEMRIQTNYPILTLTHKILVQQNAWFTAYLHLPFKQIPPFRQDTAVQAKQNKKYQI